MDIGRVIGCFLKVSDIIIPYASLPSMSNEAVAKVRALETFALSMPQETLTTHHLIHGGLYARTIMVPAGVFITGALIKLATVVIVSGHTVVYTEDGAIELQGYHVLPASAGRKQVFLAKTDIYLTALFPTQSKTVPECEAEFTNETDMLASHREVCKNIITVTGE